MATRKAKQVDCQRDRGQHFADQPAIFDTCGMNQLTSKARLARRSARVVTSSEYARRHIASGCGALDLATLQLDAVAALARRLDQFVLVVADARR